MTAPALSEALSAVFGQMSREVSRNPGALTRSEYTLLALTSALGPSRMCALAEAEGHDPSTTSRRVSALEARGLLDRTPDPEDRRAQRVVLTTDGDAVLRTERRRRAALVEDALAEWDDADRAELTRLLDRLRDTLDHRATTPEGTPA